MPRGRPHYRLTLGDVLAAHDAALVFGGRAGYVSLDSVQSAIARPYVTFAGWPRYPRIAQKVAALVESLVNNHGFIDGNKRTAVIALNTLLIRSGYRLSAIVTDSEIETLVLDVAQNRMRYHDLVLWLSERIEPNTD